MAVGSAGFHHPAVHAARLLHLKKHRQQRRSFLIEGNALLEAALAADVRPTQVFCAQQSLLDPLQPWLHSLPEVLRVDQRTIESLAQTKTPQGIVAVVPFIDRPLAGLERLLPSSHAVLVLVLHDVSDPGNAGALVRSAEAFGAAAICFGPHAVEPYNEKVVRASMGSLFRMPLIHYESWAEFAQTARATGLQLVAADAGGADVRSVTLPQRVGLLVGQERHGIRDVTASDLAMTVGLPQRASVESLNAAVAGSILLYEIGRSQGILDS